MTTKRPQVFSPDIPPDTGHAALIREEAIDWIERTNPGSRSFSAPEVLRMSGDQDRRWLIPRLRSQGIGTGDEFSVPTAADALTVLFLRSRGVKFRDAVDAVGDGGNQDGEPEPRYGGIWNRLIRIALKRMRRRIDSRILASAVFALVREPEDHTNCLVIITPLGPDDDDPAGKPTRVRHERVYRGILDRPAPSCWVFSPFRELLFLDADQLPTRSEITSRHFTEVRVRSAKQSYRLQFGTMSRTTVSADDETLRFVGRVLDVIFIDFENFLRTQTSRPLDTRTVPERTSDDDLQLWLLTQLIDAMHPASLSEVNEAPQGTGRGRVLASSVTRPWERSPWDPPGALEMLSGYAGRIGIPLVVEKVVEPWTSLIEYVEPEIRYLEGRSPSTEGVHRDYAALALPIQLSTGGTVGCLYILMPWLPKERLDVEVRVLTVLSRIAGEIIERQRAAIHTAGVTAEIATSRVLGHGDLKAALQGLLERAANEIDGADPSRDIRLPFLLLSAQVSEPERTDPALAARLKDWITQTLGYLQWRSFVRTHLPSLEPGEEGSFTGELPGAGIIVAPGRLVTKSELDQLRIAVPRTVNNASPVNAPVKIVAWVLDVPAHRIASARDEDRLEKLADDVVGWAYDVATVVDDVARSESAAREKGDWDQSLRWIRRGIGKEGGRRNGYLYRMAAECSFSLGDWPEALKYSKAAGQLNRDELGSGFVRATCLEGDAYICLGEPLRAWNLYSAAAEESPSHPLPRYYRGQALLLIAKLLRRFEAESLMARRQSPEDLQAVRSELGLLVSVATDDLTRATDLLEHWGLIPHSYQYRNFHLVPTLLGQAEGYMLDDKPGPAASRLQSARRAFPKDDLLFREYLFAKCWEQGLHRHYGALVTGEEWQPFHRELAKMPGMLE